MMKKSSILLSVVLLCCSSVWAGELFFAEAEMERGPKISRITVSIVNNADKALELHTGSHGGPGQYDDRVSERILGTPVTALPEFTFQSSNHWTTVRAPAFGSAITQRSMRPHIFVVPPKSRRVYYSFQVPSLHIRGEFSTGRIIFPEANEVRPHFARGAKELVIGILKYSEIEPGQKNPEPFTAGNRLKAPSEE